MSKQFASDYVEVSERMQEFFAAHPDGSLQADPPQFVTADGKEWVVLRAYAYRSPDDPRPGIGTVWELIPGRTPYTKTSEVMNAETSAWGRALAALGIATKKGIATGNEVRSAQARQAPTPLDIDHMARGIAIADLDGLRKLWTTFHAHDQWGEIEPLIAERRAQLEAAS